MFVDENVSITYLEWLQQKHPAWLFKQSGLPESTLTWTNSNSPHEKYDSKDCSEVHALRRAWVNMKEALYEHYGGFEIGHGANVRSVAPVVQIWEKEYTKGHGALEKGMVAGIKEKLYKHKPV